MPALSYIDLASIRTNQAALRDVNRQSDEFMELRNSIKAEGVVNPINVRVRPGEDGKKYELVDGLQRFTAALEVGTGAPGQVGKIPAQILEREDADALVTQIVANAQRIETKPVEYAAAIRRLLGYNPTWTEATLAAKLNKSPQWIARQLGLLKLHDQIRPLVNDNKITILNAYALSKLPQEEQLQWLDRAQTVPSDQFTAAVLERVKAIRDANRKGLDASPEEFIPVAHLRSKKDIEEEMRTPQAGPALIQDLNTIQGLKSNPDGLREAALRGFVLALQWSLNFDPKSVEIQKQKDAERRKKDDEAKARRDAERKDKRVKELAEKESKAREEAQKAKDAAAAPA